MDERGMTMKTMQKGAFVLLVGMTSLLFLSTIAWAMEIEAVGEGRTRQEAINNGTRAAVEQALGTLVKSQTQVTDGKLIWDRIASASAGYVKSYDVIAEGKDPVSDIYKVKLNVKLDDHKLKGAAEEFLKDPRAQRTFQETKFDERRVAVFYVPRTGFDLPEDSKGVQTVMDLIQDKLTSNGFRVFLPEQMMRIKGRSAERAVNEETAIDIARQETADAAVFVSFDAAKSPTSDGYNLIMCTLTLKAFDTTTGELFANVQDRDKTISRQGDYAIQDGVARAAIKVGPDVVDRLTLKIVERLSGSKPKFVSLIFRNVSSKDQEKVEDILVDLGWKVRIARQAGTYIEFEVFADADPTSVRSIVRREIAKTQLQLTFSEMVGSRLTWDGKEKGGY
jgi:hypothetical protein